MRWKARSSSPARRCNGCATASGSSRTPAETGALAAAVRPRAGRLSGAGLRRPGRAAIGTADARGAIFGLTRGATRKELARAALESVGYQTARSAGRDERRLRRRAGRRGSSRSARRRRHGGQRLDDAVSRRHARRAGRPARDTRRPRRSAPPSSPAGAPASIRRPANSPPIGGLDRRFAPTMSPEARERRRAGWRAAVEATLHRREPPR